MKKNTLSFSLFKDILSKSFYLYPKAFLRILVISLFSLGLILLAGLIIAGIGYGLLGYFDIPAQEVLQNQIPLGKEFVFTTLLISLGAVFFLGVIAFSILGKIASVLVVKRIETNKKQAKTTLWKLYFKDAPKFFWRYILNGLRITWYVLWPILITALCGGLLFFGTSFLPIEMVMMGDQNMATLSVAILSGLFAIYFLVKRTIASSLTQNTLIIKDIPSKESFEKSLSMTKGRIGRVLGFIFGFGAILSIGTFLLNFLPQIPMLPISLGEIISQILMPPFGILALYIFTNTLLKQK